MVNGRRHSEWNWHLRIRILLPNARCYIFPQGRHTHACARTHTHTPTEVWQVAAFVRHVHEHLCLS